MEHKGLFLTVYCQPTKGCNCSRSGVNMRVYLLRNNYSRNFSSIRSGPLLSSRYATSRRVRELLRSLILIYNAELEGEQEIVHYLREDGMG